jgi:hypothetical protein
MQKRFERRGESSPTDAGAILQAEAQESRELARVATKPEH